MKILTLCLTFAGFCLNCQSQLPDELKDKINAIVSDKPVSGNPLFVKLYVKSLISEAANKMSVTDRQAFDALVNRAGDIYANQSGAITQINEIIRNKSSRIGGYEIQYGEFAKALYVKNGNVQLDPAYLKSQYEYSNQKLFEAVTDQVNGFAGSYIKKHYDVLVTTSSSLATRIRNGERAAVEEFFNSMAGSIRNNFDQEVAEQIKAFDQAKENINKKLANPANYVAALVTKADELNDLGPFALDQLFAGFENNIAQFDDTYVAAKLLRIFNTDEVLYKKIKSADPGSISSFINDTETEIVAKYRQHITKQTDNLMKVQNSFREKLIKGETKITSFVNNIDIAGARSLKDIQNDYRKVVNVLPTVSSEMLKLNQTLQNAQGYFQKELESFYNRYVGSAAKKADAVLFLTSFFVDTKDAQSALTDVKNSLSPKADDFEKEFNKSKVQLMKARGDFMATADSYLNTAGLVVSSLQVLGIGNSAVLSKVSKGLQIGQGVFNAVSSIASGNILGAVAGLAGVFGFGGPDPAAERHKQVMEALDRIDSKLDIINEKLDVIMENQRKMFDLQVQTYKEMIKFRNDVMKEFDLLNDKVDVVDQKVNYLIALDFEREYTSCDQFCRRVGLTTDTVDLPDYVVIENAWEGILRTEGAKFENFFTNHSFKTPEKKINLLYLSTVFDNSRPLTDDEKNKIRIIGDLDAFYKKLQNKAKKIDKELFKAANADKVLLSLSAPLYYYNELNYKLSQDKIEKHLSSYDFDFTDVSDLISLRACYQSADLILKYHPIVTLTDPSLNLVPPNERFLAKISPRANTAKGYLQNSLHIVNAGIVQQNLFSGDLLLETLRQEYKSFISNTSDSTLYKSNNELFNSPFGEMLYNNFIRYYIAKEMELSEGTGRRYSLRGYEAVFNQTDSVLMNTRTIVFPFRITYVDRARQRELSESKKIKIDTGWHCIIDEQYHPMPAPIDFFNSEGFRLRHTEDLAILLNYRDKLINAIDGYEIMEKATNNQKRAFNLSILSTVNPTDKDTSAETRSAAKF